MAKEVWTAEKVEKILVIAQDTASLNDLIHSPDDDASEIGDFIEDPAPNPAELLIQTGRKEMLIGMMSKYLKPREMEILLMRFGFQTEYPMTLQECGDYFGITRERTRQIEARALRRLRYALMKNNIYCTEDT